jgi:hypothetical protein
MRISGINKKNWEAAYQVVRTECAGGHVNEAQVKVITHAAIESLYYEKKEGLKGWKGKKEADAQAKKLLQEKVRSLVVSNKQPWDPHVAPTGGIQPLIMKILEGNFQAERDLIKIKGLVSAIMWKKNLEPLKEMRALIGKCLEDMHQGIEARGVPLTPSEQFHFEVIIGDFLSVYPFLRPEAEEKISVPFFLGGKSHLAAYKAEPLRLTPKWMGSPLMGFGLNPVEGEKNAPPLLLFKGTTFATDQGHNLSLLTDINPGGSVGSLGFKHGKKVLQNWFDKQNRKALVIGKSLGGSQAWRAALHFPDQVGRVMSYAPPGFYPGNLKQLGPLKKEGRLPEINIFIQKTDIVSYVDLAAKEGVNYYLILGEKNRKGMRAHASIFSSNKHAVILKLPHFSKMRGHKRRAMTVLRVAISILFFPFFAAFHASQTGIKKLIGRVKHCKRKPSKNIPRPVS